MKNHAHCARCFQPIEINSPRDLRLVTPAAKFPGTNGNLDIPLPPAPICTLCTQELKDAQEQARDAATNPASRLIVPKHVADQVAKPAGVPSDAATGEVGT